jgi:hypothetical protein
MTYWSTGQIKYRFSTYTESDWIFFYVGPQSAPRLNVISLKIFLAAAQLASPAVTVQDFPAELAMSFRGESQAWPLAVASCGGFQYKHIV